MSEPLLASMSPENLTSLLRSAGALGGGRVSSVVAESTQPTKVSRITRLRLAYDGAAGSAPAALILKAGLPERIAEEVEFYLNVGAATPPGVLPRCFLAELNPETRESCLLLEDLSGSHTVSSHAPMPPTRPDCERIVRAWARFHAYWWDDPRLGESIGRWPDAEAVDAYWRAKFAEFDDLMGDRMPAERRDLHSRLLDRTPALMKRTESQRCVTITHGDAHFWNCFLPRDGGDDVRLFDWSDWSLGVAADDLAYMMAMHWYPDRRRRLERALLDAYHAALLMHGVKNYDRQALDDDYRLSALWQIMTPVCQAEAGLNIPALAWWNNFERIHMAIEDLGCRELLE